MNAVVVGIDPASATGVIVLGLGCGEIIRDYDVDTAHRLGLYLLYQEIRAIGKNAQVVAWGIERPVYGGHVVAIASIAERVGVCRAAIQGCASDSEIRLWSPSEWKKRSPLNLPKLKRGRLAEGAYIDYGTHYWQWPFRSTDAVDAAFIARATRGWYFYEHKQATA
jgi:hypothetical protein